MRELRKDELIKQFQSFTYIEGESFSSQVNRYIRLVSDLKSMNRYFEAGEVNKRFLDSLPSKWRVYCIMVKRFENLGSLTVEGLVAILETYNAEMIRDEQNAVGYNKPMGHALAAPISGSSTSSYGYTPSAYALSQFYQQSPASNV